VTRLGPVSLFQPFALWPAWRTAAGPAPEAPTTAPIYVLNDLDESVPLYVLNDADEQAPLWVLP
jgi:hypothetical protein